MEGSSPLASGLLLLLLEEPEDTGTKEEEDKDDEEDLTGRGTAGLAGLEVSLELFDGLAAILVDGIAADGDVLDEALAHFGDLVFAVVVVSRAGAVLSTETAVL